MVHAEGFIHEAAKGLFAFDQWRALRRFSKRFPGEWRGGKRHSVDRRTRRDDAARRAQPGNTRQRALAARGSGCIALAAAASAWSGLGSQWSDWDFAAPSLFGDQQLAN